MPLPLFHIDAFTDRPFAGNPAAVCLLERDMDASWMQSVAREMNLSETAFLLRGDDGFGLRWFTPEVEVDLCGHATLASAHFLWQENHLKPKAVARFHTQSGVLIQPTSGSTAIQAFFDRVRIEGNGNAGLSASNGLQGTTP